MDGCSSLSFCWSSLFSKYTLKIICLQKLQIFIKGTSPFLKTQGRSRVSSILAKTSFPGPKNSKGLKNENNILMIHPRNSVQNLSHHAAQKFSDRLTDRHSHIILTRNWSWEHEISLTKSVEDFDRKIHVIDGFMNFCFHLVNRCQNLTLRESNRSAIKVLTLKDKKVEFSRHSVIGILRFFRFEILSDKGKKHDDFVKKWTIEQ